MARGQEGILRNMDVKNAFNTARLPVILGAMNRILPEYLRIVVGSYFRDRVL